MPKITDTYALAYACCETILKELNRFPTIDLIRERIGVNSPNTIKKAMNAWTEAFTKQYIEQQQSGINCPEVPALLTNAVYQLWQYSVKEAEQLANVKTAVLQTQLDHLQQAVEQYKADLSEMQQGLENKTHQLNAANTQISTLNHENSLKQKTLQETLQRENALANTLEELSKREITLKEQHTQHLQQEQDWMQRRILEEREWASEKWQEKQHPLEERLGFLKAQVAQAQQAQALVLTQNQQLLAEITQLKAQQRGKKT
ncbi:MAG: DNA-binding protein, partial [Methylococcaceae bacterium]